MKYIYKTKGFKMENSLKERIEEEMGFVLERFSVYKQDNYAHVNLEKLKNHHYQIKIEIWLSVIKKKLMAASQSENIYTTINQLGHKISAQIGKYKDKKKN